MEWPGVELPWGMGGVGCPGLAPPPVGWGVGSGGGPCGGYDGDGGENLCGGVWGAAVEAEDDS